MKVTAYEDVHEFWRIAGPLYSADPVRHTVALSVVGRLLRGIGYGDDPPLLLTVADNGTAIGAVFCTPPYPLGLSAMPVEAASAVVDVMRDRGFQPRGASGERAVVDALATAWRTATGVDHHIVMNLRLYRLAELTPPRDVLGELRLADEQDFDLLLAWRTGFVEDTQNHADLNYVVDATRASLAAGSAHGIWEVDGKPVSIALAGVPSEGMSRVGLVYTPPELRRHGYASAVTAGISQWALDNGARDVVLFTDLANPISNSIYQQIGYRPVLDALEVSFPTGPQPKSGD